MGSRETSGAWLQYRGSARRDVDFEIDGKGPAPAAGRGVLFAGEVMSRAKVKFIVDSLVLDRVALREIRGHASAVSWMNCFQPSSCLDFHSLCGSFVAALLWKCVSFVRSVCAFLLPRRGHARYCA